MTDSNTTTFGGFGFAIRTFPLKGTDLVIMRGWSRESDFDPQPAPKPITSIHGKGFSEKDSVCVIGSKDKVKEFDLTVRTDEDTKAKWERLKENDLVLDPEGESSPELRLKRHIREKLDEAPPTAVLLVADDDWELGAKGGWSVECEVPKGVFERLEADLAMQQVQQIQIGIEWVAGLVYDKHVPPGIPTTWGLFKTSEDLEPEPLYGHVTWFGWQVSLRTSPDVQSSSAAAPRP